MNALKSIFCCFKKVGRPKKQTTGEQPDNAPCPQFTDLQTIPSKDSQNPETVPEALPEENPSVEPKEETAVEPTATEQTETKPPTPLVPDATPAESTSIPHRNVCFRPKKLPAMPAVDNEYPFNLELHPVFEVKKPDFGGDKECPDSSSETPSTKQ
uniref:AGC-kinase C-terminal domain-containing protein n=1 Tax=Caenorhabditis tropicalis TaxID=1561998 RepID=A0A1I7TLL4_9PELO